MATARLSSKGQLVLPKSIRDAHHLRAGSELEIEDGGDVILLRPKRKPAGAKTYSVDEVAGFIKYHGPPVTLADMDRGIMDEARRRWDAGRG